MVHGNAEAAGNARAIAKKWDAITIAVDTDWFAFDLGPLPSSLKNPVKHIFQIACPTATVVNLQLKFNSITKIHNFNGGTAIGINNGAQYAVVLQKGMTYNIQHKTATQNCAVTITESPNTDL